MQGLQGELGRGSQSWSESAFLGAWSRQSPPAWWGWSQTMSEPSITLLPHKDRMGAGRTPPHRDPKHNCAPKTAPREGGAHPGGTALIPLNAFSNLPSAATPGDTNTRGWGRGRGARSAPGAPPVPPLPRGSSGTAAAARWCWDPAGPPGRDETRPERGLQPRAVY